MASVPALCGAGTLSATGSRSLEGAVAGARRVDSSVGAGRENLDGDCHGVDAAFVPEQVQVPSARIDKAGACLVHLRRAGGVVTIVGRDGAGLDRDQTWTSVCVPTAVTSWSEGIADHVDVRGSFRLHPDLVWKRVIGFDVDLVEVSEGDDVGSDHRTRRRQDRGAGANGETMPMMKTHFSFRRISDSFRDKMNVQFGALRR